MAPWRNVAKRVLFAVFAIYLVLTVTFGFITLTADPKLGLVAYGAGTSEEAQRANASERKKIVQEAPQEYKAEHNLDDPLGERYVNWMIDITTLQWGESETLDAPVTSVLRRTIPNTLSYVVPAMLFALVGGIAIGLYSALNPGTLPERLFSGSAYLGFGIPNYWLAVVAMMYGVSKVGSLFFSLPFFHGVVFPAVVLGTGLLAGQARYARAEASEYVNTEFLKLLRAKGASNWRVG